MERVIIMFCKKLTKQKNRTKLSILDFTKNYEGTQNDNNSLMENLKKYNDECNKLEKDIIRIIKEKREYNFDFDVETKWDNCSLRTYFIVDDKLFHLSEITCESGFTSSKPKAYSDIHIRTCRLFRNMGITGVLLEYYKNIAKKEGVEIIGLGVSPIMYEFWDTEYERLIEILNNKGFKEIKTKALNSEELIEFYSKHDFVYDKNSSDCSEITYMYCILK